jgi:phosphoribosyl 1,2-cyclic phosphodiesterase
MLEICALASGSNGNCYYIGNSTDAVLVDAGISTRQILQRMYTRKLDYRKIRGVFISHEHSDHVRGLRILVKKLGIPAFLTSNTYQALWRDYQPSSYTPFQPGCSFRFRSFTIHPFRKNHDAREACSFRIEHEGLSIGVFTDIGAPCENVTSHLALCHALFLETNYDEDMLWKGKYPAYLKKRVASEKGHLSNRQSYELLSQYAGPHLRQVLLSHLSAENNRPETAYAALESLACRYDLIVTSRQEASAVVLVH